MAMSTRPGRSNAGSRFSMWFVVIIRIRPSTEITPSMAFRSADREMPGPSLLLLLFSRSVWTVSASTGAPGVPSPTLLGGAMSFFLFWVVRPAASISSSTIIEREGRLLNKFARAFSVVPVRLTIQTGSVKTPANARHRDVLPVPGGPERQYPRLYGIPRSRYHFLVKGCRYSLISSIKTFFCAASKTTVSIERGTHRAVSCHLPLSLALKIFVLCSSRWMYSC